MEILAYFIISVYIIALVYITFYCMVQLHLLFYYQKYHRNHVQEILKKPKEEDLSFVTIQLPIFNEMYVVERLIDNIVKFDYPKDKYEIHVLDDSTDETVAISKRKVAEYKAKGFNIEFYHRKDRSGYKAGALKEAMVHAKGNFIAIFDADFLPRPEFLRATIPHFNDEKIGVVQTRWEHINQNYSMLTRLQAMQLNVHFTVEQQGRRSGNLLLQFNGTAGVWRRQCIDDAGGWEADTLTEDLDLSYRAQLKGWKIKYLEKFGSPAELPAEMNGLKSQQFRWMKGGAENARKLLPTIWKSDLGFKQKMHATGHLMNSGVFLFVFVAGVFSVPMLFAMEFLGFSTAPFAVFLIGTVSVIAVYYVANVQAELNKESYGKMFLKFVFLFPVFLALSMGLSLHNTIAVIQGYIGKQTPFIRTPKFNIVDLKDSFKSHKYLSKKLPMTTIFEGLLSIYFLGGLIGGFYLEDNSFMLFHLLLMFGFGGIFFYSVRAVSFK
jgi:cellulose synthase/poly-beta-1,6-N-acetylglucosamine synthase-like glycosyltransferase